MVISQFHPIVGGAEKQALLLSKALKKKGHEVTVVTGWWLRGTLPKESIQQIPVLRNFCVWGMSGPKWRRPLGPFTYMVTLFLYLFRHRKEYHIIHIHQALYPAFVGVVAGRFLKKPTVVKVGCSGKWGDIETMSEGKIPFGQLMLKRIRHCDRVIAMSRQMREELAEFGFPQEKIVFIPNGVMVKNRKEDHSRVSRGL
ncbi:MAG: glycosyltransferase, partial [candidate division Zixibacteria bacterium]|nr:glycosyltransferase [candidate division Zixibacteria bacterium]